MKMILVLMFLPLLLLLELIIPMTSARLNSVRVISYRELKKTQDGPVMCALDVANETISSSSLKDCSVNCGRDVTCNGFNIKNSLECDVYNYEPKFTGLVSACMFYQVATISKRTGFAYIDMLTFIEDSMIVWSTPLCVFFSKSVFVVVVLVKLIFPKFSRTVTTIFIVHCWQLITESVNELLFPVSLPQ